MEVRFNSPLDLYVFYAFLQIESERRVVPGMNCLFSSYRNDNLVNTKGAARCSYGKAKWAHPF